MKLSTPYNALGFVDPSAFDTFRDLDHPLWPSREDDMRSNRFSTHKQTRSIVFRWGEREDWPKLLIKEYKGWGEYSDIITPLWERVASLAGLPDTPPINFMIADLFPGGTISPHHDLHPFFAWARRFHVPLYIPTGTIFNCRNTEVPLARGEAFELSNRDEHSVVNPSTEHRFHIVMDFAPR